VPVSGYYQFGGVANLAILQPTAGREAQSRASIEHVHRLIGMIEAAVSDGPADNELAADRSTGFQQYISSAGRFELAKNVSVDISVVYQFVVPPLGGTPKCLKAVLQTNTLPLVLGG
jgi:hypothetical protein